MSSLLLKKIKTIYTFNHDDEILEETDLFVEDGVIMEIGKSLDEKYTKVNQVVDCNGLVALPGFVNTHHHLYQTLFRGIKEVQELPLFPWLKGLYQFWQHMDEEAIYYGAMVGMSELLRTGCTYTADHHYVFPQGAGSQLIDTQIKAAKEIGIRFHATRGSMSLGVDDGGLPPMSVVQTETEILNDSQRLIDSYHDTGDFAMTRIALAPCSPFSVTDSLMKETAKMARQNKVMLHTHLAETKDEEKFCLEKYGLRPFELMESLEWVGQDVWFAHSIYLNDQEISRLNGSGIAHCPSSNMKLNSGICRTSELVKSKAKLSLAVDGSASNDGSNMWEEVRRMYLLNHLKYGTQGLNAYECLKVATRGGAEVLGRNDIGYIQENMGADLILFDLNDIAYAGCHDPLVSLVSLGNHSYTKMTIVNGKIVAKDGELTSIDTDEMAKKANQLATEIVMYQREKSF
ncbi:8-oxoguanine deaminase [Eubacteriaceae bacterium ES3]|nr:8-oxoguanine deaminase [Eubacteriaceae bacterium ES3]